MIEGLNVNLSGGRAERSLSEITVNLVVYCDNLFALHKLVSHAQRRPGGRVPVGWPAGELEVETLQARNELPSADLRTKCIGGRHSM